MNYHSSVLLLPVIIPFVGMLLSAVRFKPAIALGIAVVVAIVQTLCSIFLCILTVQHHQIFFFENNFFIDALSAYHMLLVSIVFLLASCYSIGYFRSEIVEGVISVKQMSRYCMLWNGFIMTMMTTLGANNMGILWVALEATTLVSAFLILFSGQPAAIEAMWKYLLICSVGIAFAFVSVLLLSVASAHYAGQHHSVLWTDLIDQGKYLNPHLVLAAFIFAFIGFGTKAGIAPMHTWLPDAHSQAPTPVSAVFSGVMLSVAIYCILRYVPLVHASYGSYHCRQLLRIFGLLSMAIAALFIISQKDIKRLLAYSSIEHIGIICVGLGIGGFGVFASLFHTFNHSIAKSLAFFAAGKMGKQFNTYDMSKFHGVIRKNTIWAVGLLGAVLALIGAAPLSIFASKLQILSAGAAQGRWITIALFLFICSIVFICLLRQVLEICFRETQGEEKTPTVALVPGVEASNHSTTVGDSILVGVCLMVLLVLGVWMPPEYKAFLTQIQTIIEGHP
ncbi:MAG: hypothetical protein JW795_22990 [Chitinivibrionales bacterium]|nr:hypothetical protein [Chitinivibrionales bacterium]